jgi:hypothetical protein
MKISFDIPSKTADQIDYFLRKRYGLSDAVRIDHVCKIAVLQETANEAAKEAQAAMDRLNLSEQEAK